MPIAVKAPPVCTAYWNENDWGNYIAKNAVDNEPKTIVNSFDTWYKTGEKDSKGMVLYRLKK